MLDILRGKRTFPLSSNCSVSSRDLALRALNDVGDPAMPRSAARMALAFPFPGGGLASSAEESLSPLLSPESDCMRMRFGAGDPSAPSVCAPSSALRLRADESPSAGCDMPSACPDAASAPPSAAAECNLGSLAPSMDMAPTSPLVGAAGSLGLAGRRLRGGFGDAKSESIVSAPSPCGVPSAPAPSSEAPSSPFFARGVGRLRGFFGGACGDTSNGCPSGPSCTSPVAPSPTRPPAAPPSAPAPSPPSAAAGFFLGARRFFLGGSPGVSPPSVVASPSPSDFRARFAGRRRGDACEPPAAASDASAPPSLPTSTALVPSGCRTVTPSSPSTELPGSPSPFAPPSCPCGPLDRFGAPSAFLRRGVDLRFLFGGSPSPASPSAPSTPASLSSSPSAAFFVRRRFAGGSSWKSSPSGLPSPPSSRFLTLSRRFFFPFFFFFSFCPRGCRGTAGKSTARTMRSRRVTTFFSFGQFSSCAGVSMPSAADGARGVSVGCDDSLFDSSSSSSISILMAASPSPPFASSAGACSLVGSTLTSAGGFVSADCGATTEAPPILMLMDAANVRFSSTLRWKSSEGSVRMRSARRTPCRATPRGQK
eukprot:Opistho-1_new@84921